MTQTKQNNFSGAKTMNAPASISQSKPASRFTKIGADGAVLSADATEWEAVLDNTTGLMWDKKATKVPNQKKAAAAVKKCRAAGFDDYREATVEELFLLADRTRSSPAIDTDYFPDCPSDWFWSSTEYQPSPGDCAWFVNFNNGYGNWFDRYSFGWVRGVRVGE